MTNWWQGEIFSTYFILHYNYEHNHQIICQDFFSFESDLQIIHCLSQGFRVLTWDNIIIVSSRLLSRYFDVDFLSKVPILYLHDYEFKIFLVNIREASKWIWGNDPSAFTKINQIKSDGAVHDQQRRQEIIKSLSPAVRGWMNRDFLFHYRSTKRQNVKIRESENEKNVAA